jgi:hypothetical protein
MIDDECEAVGGMRVYRENQSTQRNPAKMTLSPPQIPHELGWNSSCGGKPASNHLSYGTVCYLCLILDRKDGGKIFFLKFGKFLLGNAA